MKEALFKGKTAFVSGGTGYIGEAICRALHEYGASVVFSFRHDAKKAKRLAKELKGAEAVQIDLRSVKDIEKKIGKVSSSCGGIDILVNNAAISQIMPLAMLEEEDVDLMLDVNVKGTIFVTRSAVKDMIRKRSGAIVNIGSIAGHRILDVPVMYAATKAAIAGATCSLAGELKRFGIRVNAVIPGLMEGGVSSGVPDEMKEDFVRHCTIGRAGTGREVAEAVCFLASDRARYINGQNIFVDGGI